MHDLVGCVVEDRFVVEAVLGRGAMGTVYRGHHARLGRPVAIKVLHEHLTRDPTMVVRFEREARLAARLSHPNLVGVIDVGETATGQLLMVLELAPGRCLLDLITAPMPRARVISLLRQLLRGLDHAHTAGLVHRDLKPENILVETTVDGDIPRIVDFGIAVLSEPPDGPNGARLTTAGLVLGTPMYMSPEQARGEQVDQRTDLFALGVIAYELLAGRPPFDGSGLDIVMQNLTKDPPTILERTGALVDPQLEAFARKLMARDVGARFATAYEALAALDAIDGDRRPRALGTSPPARVLGTGEDFETASTQLWHKPKPFWPRLATTLRRWMALQRSA